MSSTPSKTHLSHVVGLRALAIILVVLFHMKASWCPQGFFGVDMFLVISGYFLLAKPLRQAAAFQFLPFVKGKLLRLMPPLCAAIAAALVLVACLQPFGDLCTAAQAALGGLCGVSNILADSRVHDYFAVDTRTDPFMHLWYMGVMFQSLLLFGILFFCWEKAHCSRRCRILSLLFLGGASLALYLRFLPAAWGWADAAWAGSTYYWTSSRLWEFALGGLLTLVPEHICRSRCARVLAVLSLVVLVAGAFIPIPDSTHYLVPAALCAAFPLIGAKEGRLNTLLSLAPLRWVGTISFSLYLVHWPLISVAEYVFYAPLTWERAVAVMLLTLCAACLLYHAAENRRCSGRCLTAGALTLLLACLLISRSEVLMRYLGAPSWLHLQNVPTLQKEEADSPLWQETDEFVLNRWGRKFSFAPLLQHMGSTDAEACFVLLGDSHAHSWAYGLNLLAREQGWSGVYLNSYYHPFYGAVFDPPATPDFKNTPERCETLFRWLRHQQGLRWVIIGNYWCGRYIDHATWDGREVTGDAVNEARTAELREFCRKIRECGKEVLILGDTPHVTGNDTMRLANWNARYGRYGLNQVSLPQVRREDFDREVRAPQASFRQLEQEGCCHVLLPGDNMFTNGVFTPLQDGQVLLADSDHLTVEGSYWALQFVLPQLKSLLGAEER